MKRLLIATTNPGKLSEIRQFLTGLPCELVSLKDAGITERAEETGKTFDENANLKASFYAKSSGLVTLADDGGFEIDALGGEPGVHSHRWVHADRDSTDEELIAYTFKRMEGVPEDKRGAQLRLVLSLARPDGAVVAKVEDTVRGIVALKPSDARTEGFPYRSILYIPEIGKYYDKSVLTPEETARYNHRKKALERLKPDILPLFSGSV